MKFHTSRKYTDFALAAGVAVAAIAVASLVIGLVLSVATSVSYGASVLTAAMLLLAGLLGYICWKRRIFQRLRASNKVLKTTKKRKATQQNSHHHELDLPSDDDVLVRPTPPAPVSDYLQRRHPLYVFEYVITVVVAISLLSLMIISAGLLLQLWWILALMVVFGPLLIFRRYVDWKIRPYEVNKKDVALLVHQNGQLWLGLTNSEEDRFPLANANLITPPQRFIEQVLEQLFGSSSHTLILPTQTLQNNQVVEGTKKITHVRNASEILAIQKWDKENKLFLQELQTYLAESTERSTRRSERVQRETLEELRKRPL